MEERSSPDSENAADIPTNEVELGRGDKERSHGKRRTAREIASMFEQLKQRHISRKREWAEEKETLMMRLQMAEESKNVLSDLKEILENLREELRHEERKRLQMELDHFAEKNNWESEKAALLKKIEESAHESDKDGKGLKIMSEKMMEQANQINALQGTEIELKRQILEKDKQLLRDKKDLHHHFESERASWKKKEQELIKKISQLSNGKSSTSSLSPSPGDVQNPTKDFIEREDNTCSDQFSNQSRRSGEEASSYRNFERKVSDALKQIEKIRSDFHEYRQESDSLQTKSSDFKTSASPSPLGLLDSVSNTSTSKVPWRTKRRTSTPHEEHLEQEPKSKPSAGSAHSLSTADATISLPSISNAQKLTPIPDRKFKKLNSQESKMQIGEFASSPDVLGQKYVYSDEIDAEKNNEERSVTQSGIESSLDTKDQSLIDSLDDVAAVKENANAAKSNIKSLSNATKKFTAARSTSPKLPKLHQQLLFKRDSTTPQHVPCTENPTKSDFVGGNDFTYSDKIIQSQPILDHASTHTPYFAPSTGYAKGNKQRKKEAGDPRSSSSITESSMTSVEKRNSGSAKLPAERDPNDDLRRPTTISAKTGSNRASTNISNVPHAPAVHPKPNVSIHKDQDGNIIHVSPAIGKRSKTLDNVTPEKQYSIAERMGKAGRDWIRKKLHFKDKIADENEDLGQRLDKKKGKQKHRRQSSLLKSKRESTSVTTSDDSSDEESRKRASLRRNRRKGKSNTIGSSSKPKKYTRSKTDGSPKEMKRFLSKFKSSQSSSKKPSVVQKFERQLLENDIWTVKEEDGTIDAFDANIGTPMPRKHTFHQDMDNHPRMKSSYSQVQIRCQSTDTSQASANSIPDCSNDLITSQTLKAPSENIVSSHNTRRVSQPKNFLDEVNSHEDDNNAERLTVSRLVNRFSTHFDDENEDNRTSPLRSSMRNIGDGIVSRSRSLTIHDGIPKHGNFSKGARRESDQVKYDSLNREGFTWHDRMIAPTDSDCDDDVMKQEASGLTESSKKKFRSLSNFWEDKHSNGNDTNEITRPKKTKFMSDEMRQKTNMLEDVLSQGLKKSRRYRRADTQPVTSRHSEDDESSSVSEEVDVIYELMNTNRDRTEMLEDFCDEVTENMHKTIPPVTGKFNKPGKPGRLPSRWAR